MIAFTPTFWFTTFWGALYLGVLLALMLPALFRQRLRIMALSLIFLAVVDRIAVTYLPSHMALAFLAFAYFLIAMYMAFVHPQIGKNLFLAFFLTIISMALIVGSFGWIDWDETGTIQELFGLFAMLSIIWPTRNGSRVPDGKGQVAPARNQSGAPSGTLATRQAAEGDKGPDRRH